MQNLATPTDLVREELTARLDTLRRDRDRLQEDLNGAEANLRKAQKSLEDNENRFTQFKAARLALEPESSFTDKPTYRVLLQDVYGVPRGTIVRVLTENERRRDQREWFVTTDPSLPVLPYDPDLLRALFSTGRTVWVTENNSTPANA